MTRIAWYTALVLTTLLILGLLWQFSAEVVLFLLSLAIEAAIHPLIGVFERRGLRRGIAIAVSYGAILTVVGGLFLLASSHLVANFKQVTDDILITYDQIKNRWLNGNNPSLNSLAAQMPLSQDLYTSLTGEEASVALQTIFGAAQGMFGFLTSLAMVIVLSVYWSLNHVQFERLWLSLLPVETRARARFIWLSIQSGAGTYLRREATLSFLAVILFLDWIYGPGGQVCYPAGLDRGLCQVDPLVGFDSGSVSPSRSRIHTWMVGWPRRGGLHVNRYRAVRNCIKEINLSTPEVQLTAFGALHDRHGRCLWPVRGHFCSDSVRYLTNFIYQLPGSTSIRFG